jgi:hypothetical protein
MTLCAQTKNAFLEERRHIEQVREQVGRIEGLVRWLGGAAAIILEY